MDFTKEEVETLKQTVELLWKKGTHHPQEAAIAFNFTKLVERVVMPQPPMLANKPKEEGGK